MCILVALSLVPSLRPCRGGAFPAKIPHILIPFLQISGSQELNNIKIKINTHLSSSTAPSLHAGIGSADAAATAVLRTDAVSDG